MCIWQQCGVWPVEEHATVIDDLTVRDTQTGAFKPKYVESILAEEIDRARRYHRSLTLSIVAADDWAGTFAFKSASLFCKLCTTAFRGS